MRHTVLLALLFLILSIDCTSQSFYTLRRDRSLMLIAGANTSTYYGDLKDDSDVLDARPSLTLGLMGGISPKVAIRTEFSWITFSGSDEETSARYRARRNLSFFSNNYELSVSGIFHLVPIKGRFYQRPRFNVYGFLGVGGLYFNPKATLDGIDYALQPLQTEGVDYSRLTLVIPVGVGVKIKVTPFTDIALEAGWRKTFSDYLDDVSTVHIDNASIANPIARRLADRRPEVDLPVAPAGTQRGNSSNADAYMLLSLKIEHYLPIQLGSSQYRKIYQKRRRAAYR